MPRSPSATGSQPSDTFKRLRHSLPAPNARNEKQRAYTTIMTIMARLHRKGLLERRRNARGFVYAPRLSHPYLYGRVRC